MSTLIKKPEPKLESNINLMGGVFEAFFDRHPSIEGHFVPSAKVGFYVRHRNIVKPNRGYYISFVAYGAPPIHCDYLTGAVNPTKLYHFIIKGRMRHKTFRLHFNVRGSVLIAKFGSDYRYMGEQFTFKAFCELYRADMFSYFKEEK